MELGPRRNSADSLSHEATLPPRRPSVTISKPKLQRSDTFVIEKTARQATAKKDEAALFDFLPSDVRPYVNKHFRMIRDENRHLLSLLSQREMEVKALNIKAETNNKLVSDLNRKEDERKKLEQQLEREKAKTKSLMKQLKSKNDENDTWITISSNEKKANNDEEEPKMLRMSSKVRYYQKQIADLNSELNMQKSVSDSFHNWSEQSHKMQFYFLFDNLI